MVAQAASLGKLSVFSSLGEPLNAEIDVYPGSPEELDSLSAALASDVIYHDQGVERGWADVHPGGGGGTRGVARAARAGRAAAPPQG